MIVQAELIPIVLFLSVVAAIKIVMDGRVRRKLAESDASETLVRSMLLTDEQNRRLSTLKWGLVLALVGMAFGLIDLLNLSAKDPVTFGMVIASAGLGMLRFHALASRRSCFTRVVIQNKAQSAPGPERPELQRPNPPGRANVPDSPRCKQALEDRAVPCARRTRACDRRRARTGSG